MRIDPSLRRGIAVVVIALLVALAFAPSINADIEKKSILPKNEKQVRLIVTEYKPDGTKESKIVKILQSQSEEMQEKLNNADDLEERLSIYKDYRLIPQNVTCEKLQKGMEEKAKRFELSREKYDELSKKKSRFIGQSDFYQIINFNCKTYGTIGPSLRLLFGLSPITGRLNTMAYWIFIILFLLGKEVDFRPLFPGFDLVDFCFTYISTFYTEDGLLPGDWNHLSPCIILLLGFVGYMVGYPPYPFSYITDFNGYAVFAYAVGSELDYPDLNS